MAFEAFLEQDKARPRAGRRITYTVSLVFHGVLLVAGVIYSFWHVDELSPPTVTVTFMSAPPAPPPPPPPPKRRSTTKTLVQKTEITQPKPDQIVQPKEEPKEEEPDEGDDDGVEGGVEGGVPGGVVGGVIGGVVGAVPVAAPPPPEPPKMLPPTVGKQQLLSTEMPHLPEAFKKVDAVYVVMAKICVNSDGAVTTVNVIKSADPAIDQNVVDTVRAWKFKPYSINNRPVPFCYVARFEFSTKL